MVGTQEVSSILPDRDNGRIRCRLAQLRLGFVVVLLDEPDELVLESLALWEATCPRVVRRLRLHRQMLPCLGSRAGDLASFRDAAAAT